MFFVLPLTYLFCIILLYYAIISAVVSNSALYRLLSYYSWSSCLTKVIKLVNWLLFSGYYYIVQWLLPWRPNFYFKEWLVAFYLSFHFLFLLQILVASSYEAHLLKKKKIMSRWVFGNHLSTECMTQIILFLKLLCISDRINKMQVTKLLALKPWMKSFLSC